MLRAIAAIESASAPSASMMANDASSISWSVWARSRSRLLIAGAGLVTFAL